MGLERTIFSPFDDVIDSIIAAGSTLRESAAHSAFEKKCKRFQLKLKVKNRLKSFVNPI